MANSLVTSAGYTLFLDTSPMLRYAFLLGFSLLPRLAVADLITFADGDALDGSMVGSTSVLAVGTLTTHAVVGSDGSAGGNSLETTDGALSIDTASVVPGGEQNQWNGNESWVFSFDVATTFSGISFNSLDTGNSFTFQSLDFVGLAIAANPSVGVAYDSGVGSFTLTTTPNNDFDLAELGGSPIAVAANTQMSLTYLGPDSARLQDMNFTAVPEPGSACCAALVLLLFNSRRRDARNIG